MVKIAIAGGSGQVAREIIDALVARKHHDITILSRADAPAGSYDPSLSWKMVDYDNKDTLIAALRGVHTVLSFIQTLSDPEQKSQRTLIDAAIATGVKRFAPSEYGSKGTVDMPWSYSKVELRKYLEEVNSDGPVLEYTLFQPGLFLDYLAFPHRTSKHVDPLQTLFDFQNKRGIIVKGHENATITLSTVADLAAIVARAVEYDGQWPTIGGIQGNRLRFSEVYEIGARVRGRTFHVSTVEMQDLEAGTLNIPWKLETAHHAVSEDQVDALLRAVPIGILLSSAKGAWDSSDEMNRLFPDHVFTSAEEFLAKVWRDGEVRSVP